MLDEKLSKKQIVEKKEYFFLVKEKIHFRMKYMKIILVLRVEITVT